MGTFAFRPNWVRLPRCAPQPALAERTQSDLVFSAVGVVENVLKAVASTAIIANTEVQLAAASIALRLIASMLGPFATDVAGGMIPLQSRAVRRTAGLGELNNGFDWLGHTITRDADCVGELNIRNGVVPIHRRNVVDHVCSVYRHNSPVRVVRARPLLLAILKSRIAYALVTLPITFLTSVATILGEFASRADLHAHGGCTATAAREPDPQVQTHAPDFLDT